MPCVDHDVSVALIIKVVVDLNIMPMLDRRGGGSLPRCIGSQRKIYVKAGR